MKYKVKKAKVEKLMDENDLLSDCLVCYLENEDNPYYGSCILTTIFNPQIISRAKNYINIQDGGYLSNDIDASTFPKDLIPLDNCVIINCEFGEEYVRKYDKIYSSDNGSVLLAEVNGVEYIQILQVDNRICEYEMMRPNIYTCDSILCRYTDDTHKEYLKGWKPETMTKIFISNFYIKYDKNIYPFVSLYNEEMHSEDKTVRKVGYDVPINVNNGSYPIVLYPKKGYYVFPSRFMPLARRGNTEEQFEATLSGYINEKYSIITHQGILPHDKHYPYIPDICIRGLDNHLNIRIDIEIDEPYDLVEENPIHYIGSDDIRNQAFYKHGWIVIRFSEKQIIEQLNNCIAFALHVISGVDPDYEIPKSLIPYNNELKLDECWSKSQAEIMARKNYRKNYLPKNDNASIIHIGGPKFEKMSQTDFEKALVEKFFSK
jgi:hypothetical protein